MTCPEESLILVSNNTENLQFELKASALYNRFRDYCIPSNRNTNFDYGGKINKV